MPPEPLILAFDTSAAHCAAALIFGNDVITHAHENMAKGQAERLFPLLEELLAEADKGWHDLSAIGVCTGPGNFTGVRISVASARGLALSLKIPAIGVSILDALAFQQNDKTASLLDARRERAFIQLYQSGAALSEPKLVPVRDLKESLTNVVQINCREPLPFTDTLNLACYLPSNPILSVAQIARSRLGHDNPRPSPLYLRPADAALPSDPPPVILA